MAEFLMFAREMLTSSERSSLSGSTMAVSLPYMMKNCLHSSSAAGWGEAL